MIRACLLPLLVVACWAADERLAVVLLRDMPNKPRFGFLADSKMNPLVFLAGDSQRHSDLRKDRGGNQQGESLDKVAISVNVDNGSVSFIGTTSGFSISIIQGGKVLSTIGELKNVSIAKGDLRFLIYRGDVTDLTFDSLDAAFIELSKRVIAPGESPPVP